MEHYKVFEVEFSIGLKAADTWQKFRKQPKQIIVAKDLDSVINDWSKYLLEIFPWDEGSGGSHYYKDPVFGDMLKFLSIKELHEEVLVKEVLPKSKPKR